jgi:HlyD family secretion protein
MRTHHNPTAWLLPAVLLLTALVAMGCSPGGADQPDPEATEAILDLPPANAVVADGRVVPVRNAALSLDGGGVVNEIQVAEGDAVEQGQLIARLSTSEQLASALASARVAEVVARQDLDAVLENAPATTAQAALELGNARDGLKDAEYKWRVQQEGNRASEETIRLAEATYLIAVKDLENAESYYNKFSGRDKDDRGRAEALAALVGAQNRVRDTRRNLNWYRGYPSEIDQAILDAELAQAQARVALAESAWEDVKDGVDPDALELAQSKVDQAKAQVLAAEAALSQAELRAPFDGVITALDLNVGEFVAPGVPVAWLADLSDWRIETTDLGEIDAVHVEVGDPATITLDALPDVELAGSVISLSGYGETRQGDITYKAVIRPEPPYPDLLWNMTAYVTILPRGNP